ncbi:MAG: hypothetical protein ACYCV7_07495 [Acidimicrobiales bacterium]
MFPVFAMAEAALGVSFPQVGAGAAFHAVAETSVAVGKKVKMVTGSSGLELAVLGSPLPGLDIRVRHPITGDTLPDLYVGELEIRGPQVMMHYLGEAPHDGWFPCGDLCYTADGQLIICGRSKESVIVGGRNVDPTDIERAAAGSGSMTPRNVAAFGVPGPLGTERVVVVERSVPWSSSTKVRSPPRPRARSNACRVANNIWRAD